MLAEILGYNNECSTYLFSPRRLVRLSRKGWEVGSCEMALIIERDDSRAQVGLTLSVLE